MRSGMNLAEADTPEKVAEILRRAADEFAADEFYEAELELASAWQDPNAGRVWRYLAKALEAAAARCDKAVAKYT